jgi:uncharacterized linocin/CFP29 family protein
MSDYLMRDDAPLTEKEWERLDDVVVSAARRVLVGRRFISLAGPFGMGTQVLPLDRISGAAACVHTDASSGCEDEEGDVVQITARQYLPLALIHKDFSLTWRDIETAHQFGSRLELGPAAASATFVARAEDDLIFQGLLNAEGKQTVPLSDWKTAGAALSDVVAARQTLADAGFYAPYALVVSPAMYALLQRPYKQSGRLESKLLESIADGGILQSPALTAKQALLISQGPHHLDLAVGQDMVTAYLGPEGMDHLFRVLESVILRVKQPGAICVIE